ncbi:unnamed protein product [Urochloa humidicola]
MRPEEKQAAAVALELLDAATARERKAVAVRAQKDLASVGGAEGHGSGGTKGRRRRSFRVRAIARHLPPGGAASSPMSFTDGNNFFTGVGTFFPNAGPISHPWMFP